MTFTHHFGNGAMAMAVSAKGKIEVRWTKPPQAESLDEFKTWIFSILRWSAKETGCETMHIFQLTPTYGEIWRSTPEGAIDRMAKFTSDKRLKVVAWDAKGVEE